MFVKWRLRVGSPASYVIIDIDAGCSEETFVLVMDGAFAFTLSLSTFHIFWS